MVFFTCNFCGSALKKNKVEKHYVVECRNPISVSCMDCLKDFYGFEYTSHNKCVTEEQKYSGQPADSKVQLGKGERKQMEWVETVRQIVETKGSTLTPQERQLLENLKDFENIPRKKKKFENFLKNAMGRYIDPRMIEKVWLLLEGHKAQAANDKEVASTVKEAESDQQDHTAGGKKKKGKESKEQPEQVKASQEDEEETHPVANLTTKKKKKHKSHAAQGDGSSEVVVGEGTESEKNERLQGEEEHLAADTSINELSKEVTTSISREMEEVADQSSQKETSPKLSKKERKEKKKKKKYELELETISKEKLVAESDKSLGVDDMDLDQGETQDEGKEKKSKKKGKKKRDTVKEEANTEGNIEATVVNGMKGAEKKKGKRKHSGNTEEESGDKKRMKDDAREQEDKVNGDSGVTSSDVNGVPTQDVKGKGKFKWDKTILSILKTVPDNELLVKRLRKKVLSEYQEALGEGKCQELSFEEALGMFERKLHKIPGVKVLKDKAKLVKSS